MEEKVGVKMTFDKQIQKVLEKELPCFHSMMPQGAKCVKCATNISKVKATIKTIIKESLPKKKEVWVEKIKYEEGKEDGHNECLDEIHKRLGI